MNEEGMLKPALIGGILLGVLSSLLSSLPLISCCCCLWIIGGGVLAAYVYVRESKAAVTLGRGAALGCVSGAIGTIVVALFSTPRLLISKVPLADQISKAFDQAPNITPESRQLLASLLAKPGMIAILLILLFLVILFSNCVLATLGGAIGVALFEKRTHDPGPKTPPDIEPPADLPPPPPAME